MMSAAAIACESGFGSAQSARTRWRFLSQVASYPGRG